MIGKVSSLLVKQTNEQTNTLVSLYILVTVKPYVKFGELSEVSLHRMSQIDFKYHFDSISFFFLNGDILLFH